MIDRESALREAAARFPNGPEVLAASLGIRVERSPLVGTSGWCLRGPTTIIRINSHEPEVRQRFTLAHELAHLILGTTPDIASEPFQSDRQEERDADQLASELFLPIDRLRAWIDSEAPVDFRTIQRIAHTANVSPLMVACRLVNTSGDLGLRNASVLYRGDDGHRWRLCAGITFEVTVEEQVFLLTPRVGAGASRLPLDDGRVLIVSGFEARGYRAVFAQALTTLEAALETPEERLRRLKDDLFGGDASFEQSVASRLGHVKRKHPQARLDDAVDSFFESYAPDESTDQYRRLRSTQGRAYVRLFLSRWYH